MNNILLLATKQITEEDLALSEGSQTLVDKHHISSQSFVLSWPPDRNVPLSSTSIFLFISQMIHPQRSVPGSAMPVLVKLSL